MKSVFYEIFLNIFGNLVHGYAAGNGLFMSLLPSLLADISSPNHTDDQFSSFDTVLFVIMVRTFF